MSLTQEEVDYTQFLFIPGPSSRISSKLHKKWQILIKYDEQILQIYSRLYA